MARPSTDGRFEVPGETAFLGRTFAEYRRLFGLAPTRLAGARVLDCAAGPSSFTAVATAVGADGVAVDPRYGPPVGALASISRRSIAETVEELREKRDLFVWDEYSDVETRARYLEAATERFLADYADHPGRYVSARLPTLPFADDAVDLALSANFLFLYDDRLDRAFHVAALRELRRVAREVRVFPLASLDGNRSAVVEPVIDRLRATGLSVSLQTVPYEFQPGATEMLVIE